MTTSLHALSGAYVVDALDDDERATFEEHLPGCLDCQAEVASLREAVAVMAHDATTTPPASLRASVLAGIATVRPLPPEHIVEGPALEATSTPVHADDETERPLAPVVPLRPRRRRLAAGMASVAAAAAIVTGMVYQPWADDAPISTLSAADQVVSAADAHKVSVDFTDGSRADVYRSKSKGRAVIITHGMAAPPAGKVFELWLRDTSGTMRPAGLMSAAGDQKVLLKGDASKADAVGITVEPEKGSTRPTTKPIAMFELDEGAA